MKRLAALALCAACTIRFEVHVPDGGVVVNAPTTLQLPDASMPEPPVFDAGTDVDDFSGQPAEDGGQDPGADPG